MDILVKHGSTIITEHVISYVREHRICTGIGTLELILSGDYASAISPWDRFDIWENGDFKVRYYVSDASMSNPDGTRIVQCQDNSKRLADYYIPDSYTIDYPSYTRYWIEKFLDEAGISYTFLVDSPGNLLSNYTALGLQPGYDQVMMLLQLSGWYMYFDGNGIAVIGSLQTNLADSAGSLGKTDIIDIKKNTNDKMLRNRALVWGAYDPFTQTQAFADVTVKTRWNYDANDIRTMVVSNQNIPNSSSAYGIANILVKEFAKLTIEKHIVAHGALSCNLGEALRVNTRTWRGKGLITTFGVSMSRDGLVTNLVLDERCPRLFGFFDFGDYVYVGTFGDGIWRKHIRFDPTWYDFSQGLTTLNITDLHINQGVFGAVGYSGQMFYANDEAGPWYEIPTITGLQSSSEDTVPAGSGIQLETFSGIMARAVIVDKTTNILKFGVDTWSGENTGDYFMTYSGILNTGSGLVAASGVNRGWIVEYDPYTGGVYTGASSSGVYPISYSGIYDIRVLDIENDGQSDYVSVRSGGGELMEHTALGYNFGRNTGTKVSFSFAATKDENARISFPTLSTFNAAGKTLSQSLSGTGVNAVFNNESIGEQEILYIASSTCRRLKIIKTGGVLSTSSLTSPSITVTDYSVFKICKVSAELYNIHYRYRIGGPVSGTDLTVKYAYKQWNTVNNTLSALNEIISITIEDDPLRSSISEELHEGVVVFGDRMEICFAHYHWDAYAPISDPDIEEKSRNYVEIYRMTVDFENLTGSFNLVYTQEFHTSPHTLGDGWWELKPFSGILGHANGNTPVFSMFLHEVFDDWPHSTNQEWTLWNIHASDGDTFIPTIIMEAPLLGDPDYPYNTDESGTKITTGNRIIYYKWSQSNTAIIVYNGVTITTGHIDSVPFHYKPSNIFPIFGAGNTHYIATPDSNNTWYFVDSSSLAIVNQFVEPYLYTLVKPFQYADSISNHYYWYGLNASSQRSIFRTTRDTIIEEVQPTSSVAMGVGTSYNIGNFFLDYTTSLRYTYLNNDTNVPNGSPATYYVLQRDGTNFSLVREAAKPIRIDISNSSPILTALDKENTFISTFVYGSGEGTTVIPVSGLSQERDVKDYRYTLLETTASGIVVASGEGVESYALYVLESGLYHSNLFTYSGGFTVLDVIPSGFAERMETTNFVYPGQYLFATTSGDSPMFYQKDNDGLVFMPYSGLPDSRATIIRCDDRL